MADTTEAAGDVQLSFKVKTSGDKSHAIAMSETATVLDLKTKLATQEFEDIPVERQRLIYSGRVMKNDDALSVYKIKTGNTIHMVKSAASNPAPPPPAAASAPAPPAVPQNMAAGTAANNILAGLTGARFAGHANLPSRDIFGADGGMGAPPTDEQMLDMLANPALAQTMNEALSNPAFVDQMIQSHPALANNPQAREMIQSPYFRSMMTNPQALRTAMQLRRMMNGGQPQNAFPAPGATDTTPSDAPSSNAAPGADNNAANAANPFGGLFGLGANPFDFDPATGAPRNNNATGAGAANPFASIFGAFPPQPNAGPTREGGANTSAAPAAGTQPQTGAAPQPGAANPFAALFGGMPDNNGANPFALPPMTPEAAQQVAQMWQNLAGGGAAAAPSPADNRPPEERYAEQLRQLNDMGFFDFDRNVSALRRSGGSVQGAIEHLLNN